MPVPLTPQVRDEGRNVPPPLPGPAARDSPGCSLSAGFFLGTQTSAESANAEKSLGTMLQGLLKWPPEI